MVNTLSGHTLDDLIGTPAEAVRWLTTAGLLPPGSAVTGAEQRSLSELRESVRAVPETHTHGTSDAAAASRLTVALLPARLMVTADAPAPSAWPARISTRSPGPWARSHRDRRGGRLRHLGQAQVLPWAPVRMGLLRPVAGRPVAVALHAALRRQGKDARLRRRQAASP
jgi:Putative stress-induced transcription regulator